jgi:hypothetical protein
MSLKLGRRAYSDGSAPRAISENMLRILRLEAALELHEIGHRLWADGERKIAPDCLRVAARCELAQAETDLLVLRSTRRRGIADCVDVSQSREAPETTWARRPRRGIRLRRPAVRLDSWPKLAASVLAVAVVVAGVIIREQLPAGHDRMVAGEEFTLLPPADPSFSAAPVASIRPASSRGPHERPTRPAVPRYQVDLDARKGAEYEVVLGSIDKKRSCSWNIVGTAADGPRSAAEIKLNPGELQRVRIPAGDFSHLSVYSNTSECAVFDEKPVLGHSPPSAAPVASTPPSATPAPSVTPTPSATPTLTEATSTPSPGLTVEPRSTVSSPLPSPSPSAS